nr:MAG: hypothetical protein [Bacteriophage sp.]
MGVQPPAPPGSGAAGRSPAGGAIRVTTNLQTNHYKIMAEIAIGRYDTNTLKTPQLQDYGSVYAAVGNALNQKYYQNREAYINRIANPLSQIKATSRGQKVLDSERAKIVEGANEFKEQDNWFAADDYIYKQTENILTNEGLKAVQADYALEQQYMEDLKKSDWDTQNQNAFLLRSRLQSSDIIYDAETNTVISGGFNGVQIGKKFDVNKYQKDVFDILSKAKADKVSFENLVTNPDMIRQYGLDVATGFDGEKLASHFVKTGSEREGITEQEIMSYAMSLLKSNPDYTNYLTTIWQNQDALTRFVKDDSSAGGHLRDYELGDYAPLFAGNPTMFALNGLGININELGAPTKDGKFTVNSKLPAEVKTLLDTVNKEYGVNVLDILQNKAQVPPELIQAGLQNYVDKMFESYAKGVLGATDDIENLDRTAFAQSVLSGQFINNNIQSLAGAAAGLYSYQDIKTTVGLIANPGYTAYVKARAKGKQQELETLQQYAPYLDTLGGFEVTGDSVAENINRRNEITDQMTKLSNSMNQIFTSDELRILGLSPGDGNIVKTLNISTAERLVDSVGLDEETAANLKGKLLQVQTAQRNYNNLQAKLRSDEIQLNSIFDTWNKHRDKIEGGIGWYRVNNEEAKIILDNRLDSYDKYVDYINQNYKELYNPETYSSTWVRKDGVTTGAKYLGDMLTKEEFESTLSNAADNVSNRYRKAIADVPLEFTATREIIANPSRFQQNYMAAAMVNWKKGAGNISVVQTPSGEGIGLTGMQLAKYMNFDAFPTSTTTNSKGTSITRQSNATKNSKPLSGKELGLDYDIYKTEVSPIANGIAAREGRNEYAITLFDETGAARGNIIFSEQVDPSTIARQILDNYRNIKPYAKIGGEGLQRSAGMIESQYASGFIDFNTTGANNSPAVANIADLQRTVDDLGKVEYNLNIHEPFNNSIDGNSRKVEIGRTTQGYYIKDISGLTYPDGSVHYGQFGYNAIPNSLYTINGITTNNIQYYDTINEALRPISEYVLTQYGILLDMQEAAEVIQNNRINNANIGY